MLAWIIGTLAVLLVAWIAYTVLYEGTLGQPEYAVVGEQEEVEFRRYTPFVIASTAMVGDGDPGLRGAFPVLDGYIFGGNTPGEELAMTVPVLQQDAPGESLPMTAPVLQTTEGKRMAFVMPAKRTLEDLPRPKSDKVLLSVVDWGEVAAIAFSGRGRQERFQEAEVQLREVLERSGRAASGPAVYAQYNSPSAFPPLRRNEVLIPLSPSTGRTPTASGSAEPGL